MKRAHVVRVALAAGVLVLLAIALFAARGASVRTTQQAAEPPSARAEVSRAILPGTAAPAERETRTWFAHAGSAPVELAGRVFADGRPSAATAVTLADELTTDGLLPRRTVVSDPEGRFVFTAVAPIRGFYRLTAGGAGGLTAAWAVVAGDVSKRDVELRLETCKLHVYGTVADASGGAVPAARVFLEKAPEVPAVADASGRFDLCMGPRAGRLHVEADGYGPWMRWISPRGALRQDVMLMPEASASGTVVFARGGAPVPFALVSLRAAGESVRDVQADADGSFDIPKIAPGMYAIEARAAGARSKAPVDVAVFASVKTDVRVAVDVRARVHGRVVTSDAAPVSGVGLNLGFNATFEWGTSARTSEDGSFTIDDAPIGNVLVKIDDHEVLAPKTLHVPEDGVPDVTIRATPKAALAVTVTRDGTAVSDATVFLRGFATSETKTTNAAGVALFKGLGEATYRVVAEHENDFAVAEKVDAKSENVALELGAGRQVAGRVVDERGAPVDGARVAFAQTSSTEDSGASAVTGPDGSFRGGPLRGPAIYRAKVTRSGFVLDPKDELPRLVVPADGPASPRELVLVVKAQDKELSGVVVDASGGPVRDARVTVARPERHSDVLATTFSGNDGAFTLRDLGAGPYAIKASAVSGSEAEVKPIMLPATSPVRIVLPSVGAIRGALRGFRGTPSVMAWGVAGYDWDFHPAALEDGRYSIAGLSHGRYYVAASTPEASAQVTVDVEGTGVVEIDLVASGTRTIHGKTLDFVTGGALPNMSCQAAPSIEGARSPVVVPGNVFSDSDGSFELASVPASDLYVWCMSDTSFRGGAARLPAAIGEGPVTVWGLDVRGRPPLDTRTLGLTMADDFPLSRRVAVVEPKGAAERSGIRVGDVIERVGAKSVEECGNGMIRNYLALLLIEQKRVPVVVTRGGGDAPLVFKLD